MATYVHRPSARGPIMSSGASSRHAARKNILATQNRPTWADQMVFYVLDQNVMRSVALLDRVRTERDAAFVVPDTAFVEMVKSDRWEDTMRRSLAALVSASERTFVSLSVSEVMRVERSAQKSIDRAALFPAEFTALIRELLPVLMTGRTSSTMDRIRARINEFRAELLVKEADPAVY
jgi:hypothetical protein